MGIHKITQYVCVLRLLEHGCRNWKVHWIAETLGFEAPCSVLIRLLSQNPSRSQSVARVRRVVFCFLFFVFFAGLCLTLGMAVSSSPSSSSSGIVARVSSTGFHLSKFELPYSVSPVHGLLLS